MIVTESRTRSIAMSTITFILLLASILATSAFSVVGMGSSYGQYAPNTGPYQPPSTGDGGVPSQPYSPYQPGQTQQSDAYTSGYGIGVAIGSNIGSTDGATARASGLQLDATSTYQAPTQEDLCLVYEDAFDSAGNTNQQEAYDFMQGFLGGYEQGYSLAFGAGYVLDEHFGSQTQQPGQQQYSLPLDQDLSQYALALGVTMGSVIGTGQGAAARASGLQLDATSTYQAPTQEELCLVYEDAFDSACNTNQQEAYDFMQGLFTSYQEGYGYGFVAGYVLDEHFGSQTQQPGQQYPPQQEPQSDVSRDPNRVSHSIVFLTVAEDQSGNPLHGNAMKANVEVSSGSGRVLIDSSLPLGVEWQNAAKNAANVAEILTETDFSTKDIIFSVEPITQTGPTNTGALTSSVDGPSAGAALTVLMLSEALQIPINNDVVITGTIEPNGMIGHVGGVPYKVQAAGELGARYVLVPAGSPEYDFQELSSYAQSQYGTQILPVEDIEDVATYFLGEEGYCACIFENIGLTSEAA